MYQTLLRSNHLNCTARTVVLKTRLIPISALLQLCFVTLCLFIPFLLFAQSAPWAWVKGDDKTEQPMVLGQMGVPDPLNDPGSLTSASNWTDKEGNLWVFGSSRSNAGLDDRLWKYTPANNSWTWMKGNGLPGNTGNFGVQGVSSPANQPAE